MNHIEIKSHRSHHGNFYLEDDNDSQISLDGDKQKQLISDKKKGMTALINSITNLEQVKGTDN